MKPYITVTNHTTKLPVHLMRAHIGAVYAHNRGSLQKPFSITVIHCLHDSYYVTESVEDVLAMLDPPLYESSRTQNGEIHIPV